MEYVIIRKGSVQPHGGIVLPDIGSLSKDRGGPATIRSVEKRELTPAQAIEAERSDAIAIPAIAMSLADRFSLFDPSVYEADQEALRQEERDAKCTWGIRAIGADKSDCTGKGITVAILDTGIARNHKAFAGELQDTWTLKNFVDPAEGDNVPDENGHGTHTAATVFGREVDGVRIGVAPGVTNVLIGKVLGADGRGSNDAIVAGLLWAAVEKKADIILMSLGFDLVTQRQRTFDRIDRKYQGIRNDQDKLAVEFQATSDTMESFLHNVRRYDSLSEFLGVGMDKAPLVIAASGNSSHRSRAVPCVLGAMFPSAARGLLSVAAVENAKEAESGRHKVAEFSNGATMAAPGVNVLSANHRWREGTGQDPLVYRSGTSMAAPHIAGLAALWMEHLKKKNRKKLAEATLSEFMGTQGYRPVHEGPDQGSVEYGIPKAPGVA